MTECQIYVTRRCNKQCGGCKLVKRQFQKELTVEEWKKAFIILNQLGIKTVKILGGEPTLLPTLEELLTFINQHTSINYAVLSNSLFDEVRLKSLVKAGLKGYFASVDGIGDLSCTYDRSSAEKSAAGFRMLMELKKRGVLILGANIVITKKNLEDVPKIVRILTENTIWANLCPIISAQPGEEFWEFRSAAPRDLLFTPDDAPLIDRVMQEILLIPNVRLAVPREYLLQMSQYGIPGRYWKCQDISQIRIDADGGMILCNDFRGWIADQFNILEMPKKWEEFKKAWEKQRQEFSCPGCYWSAHWAAVHRIKTGGMEFDYILNQ